MMQKAKAWKRSKSSRSSGIRLPNELFENLEALCAAKGEERNSLIIQALEIAYAHDFAQLQRQKIPVHKATGLVA